MKRKKLFLTLGLLILASGVVAYKFLTYPDFSSYKVKILEQFKYDKISDPDNYLAECANETKEGIKFPLVEPAYAVLHYDSFWKSKKKLNAVQLQNLIALLNDTSSYQWGEIGTPYFDRFVTFHDKEDLCIGITEISYDGQTYSTPSIAKMKWGALQGENLNNLIKILEEK